ncbi:hypothetical protein BDW02DRAFT_615487 [Decorospora gaudefroyi]|uniref:Uncharacterized protein n=1 Tax=Decorospora gaudefroyi TaxID=184978 RepID=A0A6A5KSF1_9PLEO|nr:hypothetical protein BDW02DRAFT_615487 [Decorospora gaudefroyi]
MKQALLSLLYWSYIQLSASLPVEEKPGFTPWPVEKRAPTPLTPVQYSGLRGTQIGIFEKSRFGIPDPTCRGKLPKLGCWEMDQFTVDKMVEAREPKANNCPAQCLFYTQRLSGAAERTANFVLWDALLAGAVEGERKYQTIWDLHDRKYYPKGEDLDATPETKCAYQDAEKTDKDLGINGCQRLYFMSMSKAMATQCSGEVFLMTMTDLHGNEEAPEDGIWWQVEFPTLIDEKREESKKVTKITYIQVPELTDEEFKEKQALPADQRRPPEELHRGEYWPKGPGKTHLDKFNAEGGSQQKRSPTISDNREDLQQKRSPSTNGFVKRADRLDGQVCVEGDECYPYPYPMEKMYEWYKDAKW